MSGGDAAWLLSFLNNPELAETLRKRMLFSALVLTDEVYQ